MPRLFVAVWPPDEVLDHLAVRPRPEADALRWTEREQWHVTLRFLGPVDDVAPVVEALAGLDLPATEAVLGPAVAFSAGGCCRCRWRAWRFSARQSCGRRLTWAGHPTTGRSAALLTSAATCGSPTAPVASLPTAKLGTTLGPDQAGPVSVALDPAIPGGPWDARIVLRSGTTERAATAKVTFPAAPATAAGPVDAKSGSGPKLDPAVRIGRVLLIAVVVVATVLVRGRRPSRPSGAEVT